MQTLTFRRSCNEASRRHREIVTSLTLLDAIEPMDVQLRLRKTWNIIWCISCGYECLMNEASFVYFKIFFKMFYSKCQLAIEASVTELFFPFLPILNCIVSSSPKLINTIYETSKLFGKKDLYPTCHHVCKWKMCRK